MLNWIRTQWRAWLRAHRISAPIWAQHATSAPPTKTSTAQWNPHAILIPETEYDDVKLFHIKFQLLNFDVPGHLTQRKLQERIHFLTEELNEFIEAAGTQDLVKQADALIDLVYVIKGTAGMLGLPWEHLWQEVHAANMRKVRGVDCGRWYIDVIKPQGWEPPEARMMMILQRYGYNKAQWCVEPGGAVHDTLCRDDAYHMMIHDTSPQPSQETSHTP